MGLFDLFKKKEGATASSSNVAKWADRVSDKRAQAYDRQEALALLADLKTEEAARALLRRFTFATDPSITDQEEKETAFEGIIAAGQEALAPVRDFAKKAESLAWPIRVFKTLLSQDAYLEELIKLLEPWDTEYSKFIDPKLQLLAALEDEKHPSIRGAVERFLEDTNEAARFAAVAVLLKQDEPEALVALGKALPEEESLRVKNRMALGLSNSGWTIPKDLEPVFERGLPPGYRLNDGRVLRL